MSEECRGVYYRGTSDIYMVQGNTIVKRQSIRKLMRSSCLGCPECEFLWGHAMEALESVVWPKEIKNGATYKLVMTNLHRHPETGLVEDLNIEIQEV